MITVVCAMNRGRVIGRDGGLPWSIPSEMAHFREVTLGKEVVMGRKTFDSIGKPLAGRRNHVLTRDPSWSFPGVTAWTSWAEVVEHSSNIPLVVIGGEVVYSLALPLADEIVLSVVDDLSDGDSFFPPIPENLELVRSDDRGAFRVEHYVRRQK